MVVSETSSSKQAIKELSLRANFSWTFVGNVIYMGSQWGMLVMLARLGNPAMVGQFGLGLAIAAPIIIFAQLNLRAVQATDAKEHFQFGDYLGLRLIMLMFAIAGISTFAAGSSYHQDTLLVIIAVGIAKCIESISDIYYGLFQRVERMDHIARSLILKAILSLAFFSVGIYLTQAVIWGVVGLCIAWTIGLFVYDIQLTTGRWYHIKPTWNRKVLLQLAWLALPLGLVLMLISLSTSIPRFFIERHVGEYELGIFVAISYLERAGTTIASALGQSASPRMAKYYATSNMSAYTNLVVKLVIAGFVIGLGGIFVAVVLGKDILRLLYGAEYMRQTLFVTIMIATGINYVASFLGYAMTAAQYFKIQFPFFAFTTSLMYILCAVTIPDGGIQAAALCLVVVAVVRVIGCWYIVWYAIKNGTKTTDLNHV